MKTKKILSLVMAIAMTLSLAATALADDEDDTGKTLEGSEPTAASTDTEFQTRYLGETSVPVINLLVSGLNQTLAFNPYKLAVSVNAEGVPVSNGTSTMNDQLIMKEVTITNRTNVPLKMEGSLKVTPYLDSEKNPPEGAAAATLSNKAIAATETAKKLYVYADFYAYDDVYNKVPDTTKTACAGYRLTAASAGTLVKHTAANRVVLQADANGTTDGGTNYVYVKVSGEATPAPTTPWGEYDKVQIDLMFSFQSQTNVDKYAVIDVPVANTTLAIANYDVKPTYTATAVEQDPADGTDLDDLATGKTGNTVAGYTCYVAPATGYQITGVKFYDKTGTTAITTVKATSTNTKDKTAPWSFVMPAENVFIQVIGSSVSNNG